jgi:hypothetical protein
MCLPSLGAIVYPGMRKITFTFYLTAISQRLVDFNRTSTIVLEQREITEGQDNP